MNCFYIHTLLVFLNAVMPEKRSSWQCLTGLLRYYLRTSWLDQFSFKLEGSKLCFEKVNDLIS